MTLKTRTRVRSKSVRNGKGPRLSRQPPSRLLISSETLKSAMKSLHFYGMRRANMRILSQGQKERMRKSRNRSNSRLSKCSLSRWCQILRLVAILSTQIGYLTRLRKLIVPVLAKASSEREQCQLTAFRFKRSRKTY